MDRSIESSEYSVAVVSGVTTVKRVFKFNDGSTVDFCVALPKPDSPTSSETEAQSIARAAPLLQMASLAQEVDAVPGA